MSGRLPRIVVTGAPGSGKTTTVNTLRKELGHLILCAPEVATPLITQLGITPDTPWKELPAHPRFQEAMHDIQKTLEDLSDEVARQTGRKAVLLDKSRIEMAAHILNSEISVAEGREFYKKMFSRTVEDVYRDYDLVLFLELPEEKIFDEIRANNPARPSSYAGQQIIGERVREVWKDHPNFRIISSFEKWEDKFNAIRDTVGDFLKIQ